MLVLSLKRSWFATLTLVSLAWPLPLLAADAGSKAADSGDYKVALFDLERAILSTNTAREEIKALESQKEYSELLKKVDSLQSEIDKKLAEAKKDSATWTSSKQESYRKDMDFLQKDYQLTVQKIQAEKQELMRHLMSEMEASIKKAVDDEIQAQHIAILLRREAVAAASKEADITDKVIDKLNQAK